MKPFLQYLTLEKGMSPRTVEAYGRDVAGFLATLAMGAVAEEPIMLGLYFNREAIFDDCIMVAPNTPFTIYLNSGPFLCLDPN